VRNPKRPKEEAVPQILVITDNRDETAGEVVYRERIALSDLESTHFSGQLVERLGWAVEDADRSEHSAELAARIRGETSLDVPRVRPER
jgi:hypothetical protein